jgi:hypothetical protein
MLLISVPDRSRGKTSAQGSSIGTFSQEDPPREIHRVFMSEKRISPQGRFGAQCPYSISDRKRRVRI